MACVPARPLRGHARGRSGLRPRLGPSLFCKRCPDNARLLGLDSSAEKLRDARLNVPDARVAFVPHDLESRLPFETGSVDVVFSNNLLECVADKLAFLREVQRILRPGGQILFAHWDWDSQTFDGPDQSLVRRAVHAWCDWKHELRHLVDEELLDRADYDRLLATQRELAAQASFFYSITGYAYLGKRRQT